MAFLVRTRPGAPVASIGGAGAFDGICLNSILAVVLAGLLTERRA